MRATLLACALSLSACALSHEERQARRQAERIEAELDAHGDMPPPWVRYPQYPRWDLGWRMGGGEGYQRDFLDWLEATGWDRAQRVAYLKRHPPAPKGWLRHVSRMVDPEHGPEVAEIEALGLVGDDVGYAVWVAANLPERRPWYRGRHVLEFDSFVQRERELAFFCRWAEAQREAGTLEAWLHAQAPPEDWEDFIQALRGDPAPLEATPLSEGRRRVAMECAVHGVATPPWVYGMLALDAPGPRISERDYAEAWRMYIWDSVDDARTWRSVQQRWPPPTPDWQPYVERPLPFGLHAL